MSEDKLHILQQYIKSIIVDQEHSLIYAETTFPTNWKCVEVLAEDESVKILPIKNKPSFYITSHIEGGYERVLNAIELIVHVNKEGELKAEIFGLKVKELETFFLDDNNSIKDLERISITLRSNRKRNKKIKVDESQGVEDVISDNNEIDNNGVN